MGRTPLKTFDEFLNEASSQSLPDIFKRTIYRLPTEDELSEVNSCKLTAEQIVNGFGYTIIGRGIQNSENLNMIVKAVDLLSNKYPENDEYKKALEIVKGNGKKNT